MLYVVCLHTRFSVRIFTCVPRVVLFTWPDSQVPEHIKNRTLERSIPVLPHFVDRHIGSKNPSKNETRIGLSISPIIWSLGQRLAQTPFLRFEKC